MVNARGGSIIVYAMEFLVRVVNLVILIMTAVSWYFALFCFRLKKADLPLEVLIGRHTFVPLVIALSLSTWSLFSVFF